MMPVGSQICNPISCGKSRRKASIDRVLLLFFLLTWRVEKHKLTVSNGFGKLYHVMKTLKMFSLVMTVALVATVNLHCR